MYVADVDGDGKAELVTMNPADPSQLYAFSYDGGGVWSASRTGIFTPDPIQLWARLHFLDLNGDGLANVVMTGAYDTDAIAGTGESGYPTRGQSSPAAAGPWSADLPRKWMNHGGSFPQLTPTLPTRGRAGRRAQRLDRLVRRQGPGHRLLRRRAAGPDDADLRALRAGQQRQRCVLGRDAPPGRRRHRRREPALHARGRMVVRVALGRRGRLPRHDRHAHRVPDPDLERRRSAPDVVPPEGHRRGRRRPARLPRRGSGRRRPLRALPQRRPAGSARRRHHRHEPARPGRPRLPPRRLGRLRHADRLRHDRPRPRLEALGLRAGALQPSLRPGQRLRLPARVRRRQRAGRLQGRLQRRRERAANARVPLPRRPLPPARPGLPRLRRAHRARRRHRRRHRRALRQRDLRSDALRVPLRRPGRARLGVAARGRDAGGADHGRADVHQGRPEGDLPRPRHRLPQHLLHPARLDGGRAGGGHVQDEHRPDAPRLRRRDRALRRDGAGPLLPYDLRAR